jgi:hypothetical protein
MQTCLADCYQLEALCPDEIAAFASCVTSSSLICTTASDGITYPAVMGCQSEAQAISDCAAF